MKYDVKKELKQEFGAKKKAELIELPERRFISISGSGNPNHEDFNEHIQALYAISYTTKMNYKTSKYAKSNEFNDYTVFPLQADWSINVEAQKRGEFSKDDFVYQAMIGIPDFIDLKFQKEMIKIAYEKKKISLINEAEIFFRPKMRVVQMLHVGSYDLEQASFDIMEKFAKEQGVNRLSKAHTEIYLSDPRRCAPEKLRTILQFEVN